MATRGSETTRAETWNRRLFLALIGTTVHTTQNISSARERALLYGTNHISTEETTKRYYRVRKIEQRSERPKLHKKEGFVHTIWKTYNFSPGGLPRCMFSFGLIVEKVCVLLCPFSMVWWVRVHLIRRSVRPGVNWLGWWWADMIGVSRSFYKKLNPNC